MVRWRNWSFAVFIGLLVAWSVGPVKADAVDCDPISGGFWDECETDAHSTSCVDMFAHPDPGQDWCDSHEEDTCNDFCGFNNVIDSDCWQELNNLFCGAHEHKARGLYIWCRCTEVG